MESDILRIVKEDLLEELGKKKKTSSLLIEPEIRVSRSFILEAIEELKKENLVKTEKGLIFLTSQGVPAAEAIIKKHSIIENYFKKTRTEEEALEMASFLEHYVSAEVIDNIKKLATLKKEDVPLVDFEKNKGLITDIIADIGLFERIVSMGICPGKEIKIINKLPNSVIVGVENKKIALDLLIAKKLKILKR